MIPDEAVAKGICDVIAGRIGRPVYLGGVPNNVTPVAPYVVAWAFVGGEWDRAMLQREHGAGWYTMQFDSIGRGVDEHGIADYLAIARKVRGAVDDGGFAGTGWKVLASESEGVPTPPAETGTLLTVQERIRFYVEAV